jgi:parallel beta-helix repeat protein
MGEDRANTIIDGGGSGDVVYISSSNVTVDGFTVRNGDAGVHLIGNYSINHVTIRNSTITSNSDEGISMPHSNSSSAAHIIEDCTISNNGARALYAHQFSNGLVTDCEVFGNGAGLLVGWSSNALISSNKVHDNSGFGIILDSDTYTTAEANEVYDNIGAGITVSYVGHDNTIRENTVRQNSTGIHMGGPSVHSNKIYHNNIINNTKQAYDNEGDNTWSENYPSGGNYWSDYAGSDLYGGENQDEPGKDVIGDSPYNFENNNDRYPLMEPWGTPSVIEAIVDIRPGSNINPLNPKSQGVLPVALLGTEDFNVAEIDPGSVMLEEVYPLRWSIEDIATPVEQVERCTCAAEEPDGFEDMTLKFSTQDIVAVLPEVTVGEKIILTVTGTLAGGEPFEAHDCILIRGDGKGRGPQKENAGRISLRSTPHDNIQVIGFENYTTSLVEISVYDVLGRLVQRVHGSVRPAGVHTVAWDASGLSSGVYFYRVVGGGSTATKKLVLLR